MLAIYFIHRLLFTDFDWDFVVSLQHMRAFLRVFVKQTPTDQEVVQRSALSKGDRWIININVTPSHGSPPSYIVMVRGTTVLQSLQKEHPTSANIWLSLVGGDEYNLVK